VAGIVVIVLYAAYQWALPKPIPGIPYNEEATHNLLGDIPAITKHVKETGEIWNWVGAQNAKLNSPIVQIFTRPFAKPWVLIADFRESQDILMRRTKEFDRSDFFGELFLGMMPDFHISMLSSNPEFKIHRRLIQDLMTPAFLNEVRTLLRCGGNALLLIHDSRLQHRMYIKLLMLCLIFGRRRLV